MSPRLLVLLLFAFTFSAAAQPLEAEFVDNLATRDPRCLPDVAKAPQTFLILSFVAKGKPTRQQLDALMSHLSRDNTYTFTSDWPGVDNLLELSSDNPPFVLDRVTRIKPDDPSLPPDRANVEYRICMLGALSGRKRGEVHIKQPPAEIGWKLSVRGVPGDDIAIRYSTENDWQLPRFRAKMEIGTGTGGSSLDLSGSGLINPPRDSSRAQLWTLSLGAKVPLGTPNDVKDVPGAEKDASGKIVDMYTMDLNTTGYRRGGELTRMGVRARVTGQGEGFEGTGYYSPFTKWLDNARAFIGGEGEIGYRKGNAEWQSLTTRAPDRGNLVARLGGVAEWAPEMGGINRDLSRGLRFFIRGRGWLDTYNDDQGKRSLRFARFLDSELFYNFEADTRVFLRGEYGELPPDLTRTTKRVYIGVGQAF